MALKAGSWIFLTGTARVAANGADGTGGRTGGGGSGGAIRVEATDGVFIGAEARLQAKGGVSVSGRRGGDGGGGRVAILTPSILRDSRASTFDVSGYQQGTVYLLFFPPPPSPSPPPLCYDFAQRAKCNRRISTPWGFDAGGCMAQCTADDSCVGFSTNPNGFCALCSAKAPMTSSADHTFWKI